MAKKHYSKILNIMLLFVVLQPIFDICSNLYIDGILKFGISTYVKPIFVFIFSMILFIKYKEIKKWWILYGIIFGIYIILHCLLLKQLYIDQSIIKEELRFLINIIYMILIFFDFFTLYKLSEYKKEYFIKLKKTISITFLLYCILFIISILTCTSGFTYEYADVLKKGYKGWYDSGQILGHSISIMFPILLYTLLKPRYKWYYRLIFILPIIIVASLIGTKVPYFIVLIVLILYLLVSLFNKIFNKFYKLNIFNLCFVLVSLISMILTYKYTPVYENISINYKNSLKDINSYNKEDLIIDETLEYYNNIINNNNQNNLKEVKNYYKWVSNSNDYLIKLYEEEKIHPSETRDKQLYYSLNVFKLSNFKYKLFGIGYLNQFDFLSPERDIIMALFSFGILGFILFLILPVKEFIKYSIYMLKNIKTNDLETYLLYASFGIFFCISFFAGYTFIYTNFSIFLVILIVMLRCKIYINEEYKRKNLEVKKITFFMLHLGYGGIETSTINTANALSKKYDIELVSFYKLNNNQTNKIDKKINVKYLYNGGPNREELIASIKNKNIIKIFKEGVKSLDILIKKKVLIVKEIRKSKSDVLISTRVDFSTLLSKYGKSNKIKIAQEHHHHNNNKKYIKMLSYKYNNIDYLFALTKTLENDYKKFLKYNTVTKIVFMPNMIKSKFDKSTKLNNNNIIFVGRLHSVKKVDDLIRIFSKLKNDAILKIIGDGDEYNSIKKLVKQLQLEKRVKLLGYLDQKEISKHLLNSKVFCMTSVTEGLPMVLLEAMSYGVPCIAYNTESGVKDIIEDNKNGYIIYDRNENEYINKLDKILKDNKLITKMSENAINTAKKFSEKEIIKRWEKILSNK